MSAINRICFNGKFLSAEATGVHRVATELVLGIDQILSEREDLARAYRWEILCPRSIKSELKLKVIKSRIVGHLTWQLWEQFELPLYTRSAFLVNLCNLAPLVKRDAITMIHDAQTFISPKSYTWAFRTWYQFALPMIGRNNRAVLTVSDFSRQQLDACGIAPKDKISVLYNGVDHVARTDPDMTVIDRLNLGGQEFALGLSNTQVHKNVRIAIEAFAHSGLASKTLVLFGGAKREDFERTGVHVPQNVVFAGYVSEAELAGLMRAARVMVFPSTTEGFGLPPLEAMYLGTPAICAPCGALPEVCGDAVEYAKPEDVDQWVKSITHHFEENAIMRESIREKVMNKSRKYNWKKSSEMLLGRVIDAVECNSAFNMRITKRGA